MKDYQQLTTSKVTTHSLSSVACPPPPAKGGRRPCSRVCSVPLRESFARECVSTLAPLTLRTHDRVASW